LEARREKKGKMIIAIDFDNTFNADTELWRKFITDAKERGHTCVCVTGRSNEGEYGAEVIRIIDGVMPIVFAGALWKREAAKRAGYDVNIWIDDTPEYVAEQQVLFSQYKQNSVD
jgi:hypothetical protein